MPSERWPNGGSRAWRKLRAQVLERDGGRCTHVDGVAIGSVGQLVEGDGALVQGTKTPPGRCEKTTRLEVHHSKPGPAVDADLEDLYTVCKTHHPKADAKWQEDAREAAARAAIAQLDVQQIDIRALMPAQWNANHVHKSTTRTPVCASRRACASSSSRTWQATLRNRSRLKITRRWLPESTSYLPGNSG